VFLEINDRIAALKRKARQKASYESRLEALRTEWKNASAERSLRAERMHREQRDVDRLTGLSLGALYYALIGMRDEKLTEEEAELLQAKLRYEEASDTLAELEREIDETKRAWADVRWIERDIAEALEEKRKLIQRLDPALGKEIEAVTEQEAEAAADAQELKEAASAGRAVMNALERAEDRLASAKQWGTIDLFGGGAVSTAIKHGRIDEAREAIHAAQAALRRFQTELADVRRDVDVAIDIGGTLTFADFFFDGLIADWLVQNRIEASLDRVREKRSAVGRIVDAVEAERRKAEAKALELARKREALVEGA